jgi:hypothetical protein
MGPGDSGCVQSNENGTVVRLYCGGGGAYDQLTGSGVTLAGEANAIHACYHLRLTALASHDNSFRCND